MSASNASATSTDSTISCGTVDATIDAGVVEVVVVVIIVEVGSFLMGAPTTIPDGRPHDASATAESTDTTIPHLIDDHQRFIFSSSASGWVSVRSPWRCSYDRS